MLRELQFVQGAVAKKDFSPALTHFHIQGGKIQGFNGVLALCSPIALDLDVTPNAVQLVKAVRGCSGTMALSMTAGGRLAVKSGSFKAFVECFPGGFPEIRPSGKRMELRPEFMEALKVLAPCVAEDASRQWARGVLFRGKSMFATNNIVLLEYFLGEEFPIEMNLPLEAINELLRIGEAPVALMAEESAVTFLYEGDKWLRTQLYTSQWPDVERVLAGPGSPANATPVTVAAIESLLPFVDDAGRIYFLDGIVATSREDGVGARLEVPGVKEGGVFNGEMLRLALERATTIDFSVYPAPCPFLGNRLRGALVGMRG